MNKIIKKGFPLKKIDIAFALTMFFMLITSPVFAAEVDTVSTYSESMSKNINAVVITPKGYSKDKKFPVIFLLHGYSGNSKNWITKVPKVKEYADHFNIIIVCPDGDFSSWYFDSPERPNMRYETYVSKELVKWVDTNYSTIQDRKSRAITGLSMGGHGAFYIAFKHQDIFSVAGSMSGAVDILPLSNGFGLPDLLGSYAGHKDNWEKNSVMNLTYLLNPDSLKLIFSCGNEDFLYDMNVKLHEKLLYNKIPHTFISAPGSHTWEFWEDALRYQLEFINTYLKRV